MLIEEIRLLSDDDNRRELQEPIIPKASRRDATLAKKRDGKPSGFTHTRSPRDGLRDEGHVARELYAPSAVTRPARSGEPRVSTTHVFPIFSRNYCDKNNITSSRSACHGRRVYVTQGAIYACHSLRFERIR